MPTPFAPPGTRRTLAVAGCCLPLLLIGVATFRSAAPPAVPRRPAPARLAPAPLRAAAVDAVTAALPTVAPVELRPMSAADAIRINAVPAIADDVGPAARPFAGMRDVASAADCLASAVYYEAASEGDAGERAVAQVVLNRVRHPAFPASVCGVVYQGAERPTGCQFTFACDGALARTPSAAGWQRARRIAIAALHGYVFAPVGDATHYHANWVVPYWASSLTRSAAIGVHVFYRWAGGWGTPRAFVQRYAGAEPDVSGLTARWRGAGATGTTALPPPRLLEDARILAARRSTSAAPPVLVADLDSGGLVSALRKPARLEADRHRSALLPQLAASGGIVPATR